MDGEHLSDDFFPSVYSHGNWTYADSQFEHKKKQIQMNFISSFYFRGLILATDHFFIKLNG